MPYKFDNVSEDEVLRAGARRGRKAEGADLVDEFLKAKKPRARVGFKNSQERDKILNSAQGYAREKHPEALWLRKDGGQDGVALIIVNMDLASGAEKDAFDKRPRGRAGKT